MSSGFPQRHWQSALPEAAEKRLLPSYGRRKGHKLRPSRQGLMESLLPKLLIDLAQPLPLSDKKEWWLEIGFGGGEHLAHQAQSNPNVGIIGCEPYINGIAGLLARIDEHKLNNIRLHTDDARFLIAKLPDASIARAFILYPDPWPKARHHKRRLISSGFLSDVSRIMKTGAELRLATDDEDYGIWMLERLLVHPDFAWAAKIADDWRTPPPDWISTRYEQKALEAGRPATYLNFIRK